VLVIRNAQLEAMRRARETQFVDRAVAHLRRTVPDRCAALGERRTRSSVALAMRKARRYQLVGERDILRYLNVMYWLGFSFDSDPAHAWVREQLSDPRLFPTERMQLVSRRALDILAARERQWDRGASAG
jgi:hypothetical protein